MSDNEFDEDQGDAAPVVKKIETKRIFVNHVDTYNGKNLSKVT